MVQNLNSLRWTLIREKSPIADTLFCKELLYAFEDDYTYTVYFN